MFSKKCIRQISYLIVGSFIAACVAGCGLRIGEQSQTKNTAEVQGIKCLDASIADIKLYFNGEATDDQVASAVQCLQDVFISFKENIRGENKDEYTAKEIAVFVETNFIKDGTTFSDDFLAETMKFKVALIGGTKKVIRENEIDQMVSLLTVLKADLIRLNKSMRIITFKWKGNFQPADSEQKEQQFLQAKSDFNHLVQKLATQFAASGNAYQLDDIFNFAKEVLKFTKSDADTLQFIEDARPFLKKFKTVLIGGDTSLAEGEWSRLGATLHEGFFQALRYEYFLKDLNENDSDSKWIGYEKIAIDLAGLIENLLDAKETQTLSNFELFEIAQTLDKIYPELALSMPFIDSIGHIKVMLLGDSPSGRIGWSKSDFAALRSKIPSLFTQIAELVETYDYLQKHKDRVGTTSPEEFAAIEVRILSSVEELAKLIARPYNLYYLKIFIEELAHGPLRDKFELPEDFEALFNSFLAVKTVVTGEEDNNISVDNIKLLLSVGARGYLNFTEVDFFVLPYKYDEPAFYNHINRILEKIVATVTHNLDKKSSHLYTTKELVTVVLALQDGKLLNTELKQTSLESVIAGLWENLLNPPKDRLNQKNLPGFNQTALNELDFELTAFLRVQKLVSSLFSTHEQISKADLLTELKKLATDANDKQLKDALFQLIKVLSSSVPLSFNENGFLKILTADVGIYGFKDILKSNIARAVSRLAIRSYAGELTRVSNLTGITVIEAEVAFKQFRGIAIDLKALEPENTSFISNRFLEANLFLSSSNGDAYANMTEIHDIVMHIFSGLARADKIKEKIVKICLPPQQGEVTKKTGVWEDCLLKVYYDELTVPNPPDVYTGAYQDLPGTLLLKKQFPAKEVKDYFFSLVKAAGHVPNDKKVVYFEDADLFPHVLQYIEMVYARHDPNRDGQLEKCEALAAFPIFHDLIKEFTVDYNLREEHLPGTFIYLLKYSRPPKTLAEKFKFLSFINSPDKWIINSTRIDLGKLFNFIADETKAKKDKEREDALKPPPDPNAPLPKPKPLVPLPPEPIVSGC